MQPNKGQLIHFLTEAVEKAFTPPPEKTPEQQVEDQIKYLHKRVAQEESRRKADAAECAIQMAKTKTNTERWEWESFSTPEDVSEAVRLVLRHKNRYMDIISWGTFACFLFFAFAVGFVVAANIYGG